MNSQQDPRNPYESYVVAASAGSGKTYQLSQRFLYLVGAGANPARILTITFTKKAATEMRERILAAAVQLNTDQKAQAEFRANSEAFAGANEIIGPQETAARILSAAARLRILTIDSLFWEWLRKFGWEASQKLNDRDTEFSFDNQAELISSELGGEDLDRRAWNQLWQAVHASSVQVPTQLVEARGLLSSKIRFRELCRNSTFLWLTQIRDGAVFLEHAATNFCEQSFWTEIKNALSQILEEVSPKVADEVSEAVETKCFSRLLQCSLVSKSLTLSARYLRGKKRERLALKISNCETLIQSFWNAKQTKLLNASGRFLTGLLPVFSELRDREKSRDKVVEFGDLAKGAYRLFHHPEAAGARFLIQSNCEHLLIDEFQDTSRLQWAIFRGMVDEILSGKGLEAKESHLAPSIFIVGDSKQSIYGFREAEPKILGEVAASYQERGLQFCQLDRSFRSSKFILDFVNCALKNLLPDYPLHRAAEIDGQPLIPDSGSLTIPASFERREDEANFIADTLLERIGRELFYDRDLRGWRYLRGEDCAILLRFNTHAELYTNALKDRGLDFRFDDGSGFAHRTEILDGTSLMRLCLLPNDRSAAAAVLKSPLLDHRLSDTNLLEVMRTNNWRETLANLAPKTATEISLWSSKFHTNSLMFFCESLLDHAISRSSCNQAEKNLTQLAELVRDEITRGCVDLADLIDRLSDSISSIGNAQTSNNAVNVLTIHKAKGLEFPFIVLADCAQTWERQDRYWLRQTSSPRGIYHTGTKAEQPINDDRFQDLYERLAEEQRQESHRLLYVALTRATQHLLISGSVKNAGYLETLRNAATELGASDQQLLTFERKPDTETLRRIEEPQVAKSSLESLTPMPKPDLYLIRPHSLNVEKQNFEPTLSSPYQKERGILVHRAIESFVKREQDEALEQLAASFRNLEASEQAILVKEAKETVCSLQNSHVWQTITEDSLALESELPITYLKEQSLVNGSLDLLVVKPNEAWIIDFKHTATRMISRYRPQLRAYRSCIEEIYANLRIRTFVLFTQSLELKEITLGAKKDHDEPKRPSFPEIYMRLAETMALRSTCKRLNVGTVITSTDYRKVLAVGYNGNASGLPNVCDRDEVGNCGCLHSEENAVINCDAPRFVEKIAFVTHLPCTACAKRLINLGNVKKVFYANEYRSRESLEILEQVGISVEHLCN